MSEVTKYKISALMANQYSSLFRSLNQKIELLHGHLNDDFLVTTNKVKRYNVIARQKLTSGVLPEPLRTKIYNAVKSFDKLIIELQYHDIIRQKLEHISIIAVTLSHEFSLIYEKQDKVHRPHYTLVMYDIIKLAFNQLNRVREEYMFASNKIQQILRLLWADREVSRTLELFLFNTAENLRNVIKALDLIIKMHETLRQGTREFEINITDELRMTILSDVKRLYTMDSERKVFNATFGIKEELVSDDEIFF